MFFRFRIARVLRVWKDSRAHEVEGLVGLTVKVCPRWEKGDDSRWHPMGLHVDFIRGLEPGEEITIEIRNAEGTHSILELSKDQRARRREPREPVGGSTSARQGRAPRGIPSRGGGHRAPAGRIGSVVPGRGRKSARRTAGLGPRQAVIPPAC